MTVTLPNEQGVAGAATSQGDKGETNRETRGRQSRGLETGDKRPRRHDDSVATSTLLYSGEYADNWT